MDAVDHFALSGGVLALSRLSSKPCARQGCQVTGGGNGRLTRQKLHPKIAQHKTNREFQYITEPHIVVDT